MSSLYTFVRFSFVGALNTAVDFIVFNTLILAFGIHTGSFLTFKTIAFTVAVANSYFWNSIWVFKVSPSAARRSTSQAAFFAISIVGLFLNVGISMGVFNILLYLLPMLPPIAAANIGAVCGSVLVMVFNFVGYKRIVFRHPS